MSDMTKTWNGMEDGTEHGTESTCTCTKCTVISIIMLITRLL